MRWTLRLCDLVAKDGSIEEGGCRSPKYMLQNVHEGIMCIPLRSTLCINTIFCYLDISIRSADSLNIVDMDSILTADFINYLLPKI